MNRPIDFNADLGEGALHEEALLGLITSASIACGFHAGDPATMSASILAAQRAGVAVGAHPSFHDRENFGRTELKIAPPEVFALVAYQLGAFGAIAGSLGVRPNHVKPHGALYNMAAREPALAKAVAQAILAVDRSLLLFAPDRSALAEAGEALGLRMVREVFADRNYLPGGTLVPRSRPDALLHDPEEASARVLRMLQEGVVRCVDGSDLALNAETVCVHGDTPDALAFAEKLRAQLAVAGITVRAPT